MTPRLSGHFSVFGLVFFVLLVIVRQWSHEKFPILTLKPRGHVGILTYIERGLLLTGASLVTIPEVFA